MLQVEQRNTPENVCLLAQTSCVDQVPSQRGAVVWGNREASPLRLSCPCSACSGPAQARVLLMPPPAPMPGLEGFQACAVQM